jgi:PAS domain S-box-containing protein
MCPTWPSRREAILLAEAEDEHAALRASLLSDEGFEVVRAGSGAAALEALRADPEAFGLALVDIDLDGQRRGLAAARNLLGVRDIPIIYLYSDPDGAEPEEAAGSGHFCSLPKYSGYQSLAGSVNTALRVHQAQRSIARSERDYRLLFENMTAGFAVHRMIYDDESAPIDYRFLAVNPAFERLTGLTAAAVVGKTVREVLPDTEQYWIDTYGEVARTGRPTSFRNYSAELERYYDTWVFSPERDLFAVVFTDITDKVRADEELQASEERFRVLFETMAQGVVFQDSSGRIEMANPAAERILGLTQDQLLGRTSLDTRWKTVREDGTDFPGEEHPAMVALRTGKTVTGTVLGVFHPDSERHRWIRVDAVPLFRRSEEKPYRVYAMFTDIGERSAIEETQTFLARRGWAASGEDFFQALAKFLSTALEADYVCIDRLEGDGLSARTVAVYFDGKFEDNVTYALRETPCGDAAGKAICCFPKSVRHLFPNDAVLQEMAAESYAGTTLWSGDGKPIGLIAAISRKPLENPALAEMVLGLVSIRAAGELERRESAEALRRMVSQKETLLKELQHRVKNNLNVVSSLLDLEADNLTDEGARKVFLEARTRIESIATIYERLYLSEDLATVDLGQYVRDLADYIFRTYEIDPGRAFLTVDTDAVMLETKRVVPLGLILNELISNSLKYSLGAGRGEIRVSVKRAGGRAELAVSDHGPGLPPGLDPYEATSMGMELVRMLAQELRGDLVYESGTGLAVRVSFPL